MSSLLEASERYRGMSGSTSSYTPVDNYDSQFSMEQSAEQPEDRATIFAQLARPFMSVSKVVTGSISDILEQAYNIGGYINQALGMSPEDSRKSLVGHAAKYLRKASVDFDKRGLPSKTAAERLIKNIFEGATAMPLEVAKLVATPGGIITWSVVGRLSEATANPAATPEDIAKAAGKGFAEGVLFHNAMKLAGVAGTEIGTTLDKTAWGVRSKVAKELITRLPGGVVFAGPSMMKQLMLPDEQQDWTQPIADMFSGIIMAGKSGQTWDQYKLQMKKATVMQKLGIVAPGFEGKSEIRPADLTPEQTAVLSKYGIDTSRVKDASSYGTGLVQFDDPLVGTSMYIEKSRISSGNVYNLLRDNLETKDWTNLKTTAEIVAEKKRLSDVRLRDQLDRAMQPQVTFGKMPPAEVPPTGGVTGGPTTGPQKVSQFRENTIERSPFTQEVLDELSPKEFEYTTESNPEWKTKASDRINSIGGEEQIEKELLHGTTVDIKGGVQTHEEAMLIHRRTQQALNTGKAEDYQNLLDLTKAAADKHREQARGMNAIHFAYENQGTKTGEGMLLKTQKLMDTAKRGLTNEHPNLEKDVEGQVKPVQKAFREADKEGSRALKDDTGLKKASDKLKETDPAAVLANKIIKEVQPKNAKEADLIKQMVGELFSVAKESPIERGVRPPAKSALAKIADAIKGNAEYQDVWDRAKESVKGTFKDDPEMVKMLDAYFGNPPEKPFSNATFDLALRQGMKDLNIDLGDIARTYFQSGISKTVELRDYLVTKSGLSSHDAELFAKYIDKRMDTLVGNKKRQIVDSLFSDRKNVRPSKSVIEQINEMINLGVYTEEGVGRIVRLKGGLPMLTPKDAKFIVETMAKVEGKDDYSPEKIAAIKSIEDVIYKAIPRTTKDTVRNVFNQVFSIPKTLMSGFADFSFGLRQGWFFLSKPKQWVPAFTGQFRAFASDANYYDIMRQISKYKHYDYMLGKGGTKERLALSALDEKLVLREERFQSQWVEKIPGIGQVVRATSRAFHGMANKLRADLYEEYWDKFEKAGLDPANNAKLRESMAQLINNGTGRGSLGKMESIAAELNTLAFAPRLFISRMRILGPASFQFYGNLDPAVRKEALKTLFATASAVTLTTALVKLGLQAAGVNAKVETDPRSADFGKLRIGNTRVEIGGSNLPTIRLVAQFMTGKVKSSETGKVTKLGAKYGSPTRWDVLGKFIEYKEAPVASFVIQLLRSKSVDLKVSGTGMGKDYQRMHLGKELLTRIAPMMIQDIYDIARTNPGLIPAAVPAMFGAGLQTYGGKPKGTSGVGLQAPTSGRRSLQDAMDAYRRMGYK